MHNAFADGCALVGSEFNGAVLQINEESALEDEEEFVVVVVLVPVEFSLYNADPYDRAVHLSKSLVEPFIIAGGYYCGHVNQFVVIVFNVKVDIVVLLSVHGGVDILRKKRLIR